MSHRPGRRVRARIAPLAALVAAGLLLPAPMAHAATDTVDPALTNYLTSADEICLTARKTMAATLPQYEKHKAASKSVRGGSGTMLATPKEVQAYVVAQLSVLEGRQGAWSSSPSPASTAELTKLYASASKALAEIKARPRRPSRIRCARSPRRPRPSASRSATSRIGRSTSEASVRRPGERPKACRRSAAPVCRP